MAAEENNWLGAALKLVLDNAEPLVGLVTKLTKALRKSPKKILIVGAGGVGKSTLGNVLAKTHSDSGAYNESLGVETYDFKVTGDRKKIGALALVPPGQSHRRDATWADLESEVRAGQIRGIIVVNAWGHHSLGEISYREHRIFKAGMSRDEFLPDYLDERRADELEIARRIASVAKCSTGKLWILSVVTKEDLWIESRSHVDKFYGDGSAYKKTFDDLASAKNAKELRFEHVTVCMSISSLRSGRGEELLPNAAGYGTPQQIKSIENLINTIASLVDWES